MEGEAKPLYLDQRVVHPTVGSTEIRWKCWAYEHRDALWELRRVVDSMAFERKNQCLYKFMQKNESMWIAWLASLGLTPSDHIVPSRKQAQARRVEIDPSRLHDEATLSTIALVAVLLPWQVHRRKAAEKQVASSLLAAFIERLNLGSSDLAGLAKLELDGAWIMSCRDGAPGGGDCIPDDEEAPMCTHLLDLGAVLRAKLHAIVEPASRLMSVLHLLAANAASCGAIAAGSATS